MSESYGYDQLDRLTSNTGAWGSISYTYDATGNMLSKGPAGYTYDTINRLTRVGASDDYEYDSNGNRASRESGTDTWTYGYDSFNRFTSVSRNSIVQRLYSYDADDRHIRSYGGSSRNTRYVYSESTYV
jgi:YD repeat-containing protein